MARSNPGGSFRLDRRGLGRTLGPLEARLMEALWTLEEATVQQVIAHLGGDLNYKTVMTVVDRLYGKGLLKRRKVSRAFVYTPVESREAYLQRISQMVARGLVQDFGNAALTQFVEAVPPDQLATLLALVEKKLSERRKR